MTKEKVYEHLDILSLNIEPKQSEWCGRKSGWSLSLDLDCSDDEEAISKELYELFKVDIDYKEWNEKFHMAVGGSGNELKKITTLHSSSLLAFLFFVGVSKKNPITYKNITYTQVFFEVKNKVFPSASSKDKPSNIDVLLVSDEGKNLLFLESKFTEYIHHGKVTLSEKYLNFYKTFFELNSNTGLQLKDGALQLEAGRNSKYIAGIKQMFSHIIGLATDSDASTPNKLKTIIKNAEQVLVKEIIFKWEDTESKNFSELYESAFKDFNSNVLEKCLLGEGCEKGKIDRIKVDSDVLTYQALYKLNKDFKLPESVKKFYKFEDSSSL